MSSDELQGTCRACGHTFEYLLIHNGFNDSAYAYCDRCGRVAILDGWGKSIPKEACFKSQGPIARETEAFLKPCACGGSFRRDAVPRCPSCRAALSAEDARAFIERDASKAGAGLKWQGSWHGTQCIIINGLFAKDNWR